jgi:hypothetical protein
VLKIDWGSLGEVFVVSVVVTVVVVGVFSLGVLAFARAREASDAVPARSGGQGSGAGRSQPGAGRSRAAAADRVLGSLCFAFCAAVILYGIYLIIPASTR